MPHNLHHTLKTFIAGNGATAQYYSLPALESAGIAKISRLPISIRIVLESILRNYDDKKITAEHIQQLAHWQPNAARTDEIPFVVSRVVLQDFTGVPLLADLAAMRNEAEAMNHNPKIIEPLVPVDLVVDHSVMVDQYASPTALRHNMELEFERNNERYQFMKWGMQAFDTFKVVPPGIGIVHQVNLEYLFRGVHAKNGVYYPDTLVGTDSHTTMINGVGVVGWGVGGIEAEAAMLGQPVYFLTPDVVGVELSNSLLEGVTATDLVLTITEMLRREKVVGKFVEFFGEGTASLSVTDRATIANMAPEYGATMGFFPVDDKTVDYMSKTGRDATEIATFKAYFQAQNLYGVPRAGEIDYSTHLKLDLHSIVPSLAGPKRPQDRIALTDMRTTFNHLLSASTADNGFNKTAGAENERFAIEGSETTLGHGDVVLAAITSCTNTSNPNVMLAAGLLAKKAVEKGLKVAPHIKTSLAPGSRVVAEYLNKSGLQVYLDQLGFNVVAFGCTTCIGNSGDLAPEINEAILSNDVIAAAVLSGNRNFEARIHPNIKANFLASPPLVVAFAIAGHMNKDLSSDPLGIGSDGQPVYLRDIWPSSDEINDVLKFAFDPEVFKSLYSNLAKDLDLWEKVPAPTGQVYSWPKSTYIAQPPFFNHFKMSTDPIKGLAGMKALLVLGDSVTTDHISPAGSFKASTPAGQWLESQGVRPQDFNSYGSRRGNHDVMVRGTFANVRVKNLMLPANADGSRIEGGYTLCNGEYTTAYDAAMTYLASDTPTIVFAGDEYGTGSSRDWAAKGTRLLGVKAVIAKSFERIHRANLVGMGVLPLQFKNGESAESLGITGDETFDIIGVNDDITPQQNMTLVIHKKDGTSAHVQVQNRIDTPIEVDYYRHGGILPFVLRQLLDNSGKIAGGTAASAGVAAAGAALSHERHDEHKVIHTAMTNDSNKTSTEYKTAAPHSGSSSISKWVGAGVAALLVALLFRGCGVWDKTVETPKAVAPAASAALAKSAEQAVATKPIQLMGVNKNGKFELSGIVPSEDIKASIDAELKKVFGEGNYINNLTVSADVKPSAWTSKITGMFDLFKLPGAEMNVDGDTMTLSGTAASLKDKLQNYFGDTMKVNALDIAEAAKTATGSAMDALNALKADASGQQVLDALSLQIINFASGSTAIPADNQAVLKKAAEFLKAKQDFKFEIGGHADNKGNAAGNLSLSDKRAAAVRNFLIANGVPVAMMTAKGYGDTMPVADNTTESGRLKNRRIAYKAM